MCFCQQCIHYTYFSVQKWLSKSVQSFPSTFNFYKKDELTCAQINPHFMDKLAMHTEPDRKMLKSILYLRHSASELVDALYRQAVLRREGSHCTTH